MPYIPSVAVNVSQAVTTGSIANLGRSIFIDTNTFHQARVSSYYSMTDVNADVAVPKDSKLYKALQNAFGNAGSRSLPIYVGRRQAATTVLTPTVENSKEYTFSLRVVNTDTQADSVAEVEISITSDVDATATEIVTDLDTALTTAGVTGTDITTAITGDVLTITPAADRQVIITKVSANLPQTFTSTEVAATTLSEIQAENNDDWYYITTSVRDNTWILALCDAVEATESSDYPKVFRVSSNAAKTLIAQTDPSHSEDLLGLLEDTGYGNCFGEWHDQSDEIFPELGATVYYGSFFSGTQNWKFMNNCKNPTARHPVLGRELTKSEVGFILDRNAAVRSREMKVPVYITSNTGDVAKGGGAWMDNLTISHWIRLNQKLRIFNALVNESNAGRPLTFTSGDKAKVQERATDVLLEAVNRKMLKGFDPVTVPSSVSFQDQAQRTLKDVKYTGYFAGKINHVIVDGVLTYQEGE